MILDRITLNSDVCGGLPCVGGSGVPVAVIAALVESGMLPSEIAGRLIGVDPDGVFQATDMPAWMRLPPGGLTAEQYGQLPEHVCAYIEVVDGAVVARRP